MGVKLEYKGYFGSVEFSAEDGVLHGRLEFIRDPVSYEGKDAKGIKVAFQEAVDDYLGLCEAEGRKADVRLKV
jgi:predicted HicB family RNase H-like nuclease